MDDEIGSMFGSCMHATDINGDGVSELIVGAPAYSTDLGYDAGAVHIYFGGNSAVSRTSLIFSIIFC